MTKVADYFFWTRYRCVTYAVLLRWTQNGLLCCLTFSAMWVVMVLGGLVAKRLRTTRTLSTTTVRKLFCAAGKSASISFILYRRSTSSALSKRLQCFSSFTTRWIRDAIVYAATTVRRIAAFTPGQHVAGQHVSRTSNLYPDTYMLSDTCCRIQVARSGYMLNVSRRHNYYSFMSRSTCIPLYPATDGRQTGNNFVADTRNMLAATSWYYNWIQFVAGQHVSSCKCGLSVYTLMF